MGKKTKKNFNEIDRFYFQAEIKNAREAQKELDGSSMGTIIEGYASTTDKDRVNDVVDPEAFRKSINGSYKDNPIILFGHNPQKGIGRALELEIRNEGLYVKAMIVDKEIEEKIVARIYRTFSIGYRSIKEKYIDQYGNQLDPNNSSDLQRILYDDDVTRVIKEVDLLEISVVSVPANHTSLFTLTKSAQDYFQQKMKYLQSKYNTMGKPNNFKNSLGS